MALFGSRYFLQGADFQWLRRDYEAEKAGADGRIYEAGGSGVQDSGDRGSECQDDYGRG